MPFLKSKTSPDLPIGVQAEADWRDTIATMEKVKLIEVGSKPSDYFTNDYLDVDTIKSLGGSRAP
jgi:hypothetical protein